MDHEESNFSFNEYGILYFKNRLIIPNMDGLDEIALNEAHDMIYFAYLRIIIMRYITSLVIYYVTKCLEYHKVRLENSHPIGGLYPHDISN